MNENSLVNELRILIHQYESVLDYECALFYSYELVCKFCYFYLYRFKRIIQKVISISISNCYFKMGNFMNVIVLIKSFIIQYFITL